jgi:hypothetical protein
MHVALCDSIESVVAAAHAKAAMLPQAEKAGSGWPECSQAESFYACRMVLNNWGRMVSEVSIFM